MQLVARDRQGKIPTDAVDARVDVNADALEHRVMHGCDRGYAAPDF